MSGQYAELLSIKFSLFFLLFDEWWLTEHPGQTAVIQTGKKDNRTRNPEQYSYLMST